MSKYGMAKNGAETRARLLDAAERLFLERGYGGTSLEAVVEAADLTKGAFFHHFDTKQALAVALIERYSATEQRTMAELVARAERLSRDPVQQVLLLVGLVEEVLAGLPPEQSGCLFASYAYQAALFDEAVLAKIRSDLEWWRLEMARKLRAAMAVRAPRLPVEADEVAYGFLTAIEGGFVLAKALGESSLLPRQMRAYRNYLELLFGVA